MAAGGRAFAGRGHRHPAALRPTLLAATVLVSLMAVGQRSFASRKNLAVYQHRQQSRVVAVLQIRRICRGESQ